MGGKAWTANELAALQEAVDLNRVNGLRTGGANRGLGRLQALAPRLGRTYEAVKKKAAVEGMLSRLPRKTGGRGPLGGRTQSRGEGSEGLGAELHPSAIRGGILPCD